MGLMDLIDNGVDTAKKIATSMWGDGFARGLSTSEREIGSAIVNRQEQKAAMNMLNTLRKNGAEFNEEGLEKMMKSSFQEPGSGVKNRAEVFEGIYENMTEASRSTAAKASRDAIHAYKKEGSKVLKYNEAKGTGAAAREYIGRKNGGLGTLNSAGAYFLDSENGMKRIGAVAGGTMAAGVGVRYLQGGNMTTTSTGEKNIAGIPFI